MTTDVYMGRKFNANHQLAIILIRHLGLDGARAEARRSGWKGVQRALDEQLSIITVPA